MKITETHFHSYYVAWVLLLAFPGFIYVGLLPHDESAKNIQAVPCIYYCNTISCLSANHIWEGYVFMCSFISIYCYHLFSLLSANFVLKKNKFVDIDWNFWKEFGFKFFSIVAFQMVGFFPSREGFTLGYVYHLTGFLLSVVLLCVDRIVNRKNERESILALLLTKLEVGSPSHNFWLLQKSALEQDPVPFRHASISGGLFWELMSVLGFGVLSLISNMNDVTGTLLLIVNVTCILMELVLLLLHLYNAEQIFQGN